jgi:hypothetical protein
MVTPKEWRPRPERKLRLFREVYDAEASTRSVTMTGTPGSNGERRIVSGKPTRRDGISSPPVHGEKGRTPGAAFKATGYFAGDVKTAIQCSRARQNTATLVRSSGRLVYPYDPVRGANAPMDRLGVDLRLDNVSSDRFRRIDNTPYNRASHIRRFPFEFYRPQDGKIKALFGKVPCCRYVLTRGCLQVVREDGNFIACFNKLCHLFGAISRERSFRYLIRILVLVGFNQADLYSIMRIRDQWVRGSRTYHMSVNSLIFKFPPEVREFISSLPRKVRRQTRPRGSS